MLVLTISIPSVYLIKHSNNNNKDVFIRMATWCMRGGNSYILDGERLFLGYYFVLLHDGTLIAHIAGIRDQSDLSQDDFIVFIQEYEIINLSGRDFRRIKRSSRRGMTAEYDYSYRASFGTSGWYLYFYHEGRIYGGSGVSWFDVILSEFIQMTSLRI